MRIGTYSLKRCPTSSWPRGQAIADWMKLQEVDVWLLTEVHRDWTPAGGRVVVSSARAGAPAEKRWSGIQTELPFGELRTSADTAHPGEEGLVLARLRLDGGPTPPFTYATTDGARALAAAFDGLGLVALTERAEHLNGISSAIDHLAVSRDLVVGEPAAQVHRPPWNGGHLSDHAAYTAEIDLARG